MAQRAAKTYVRSLKMSQVTTKQNDFFLKKNILFEKRLKISFLEQYTTDKQYIQNTWKTVIVINEFSYLYFQVRQFWKYPLKNCTE